MNQITLARYASTMLVAAGGGLAGGAIAIGLGQPALGWTIYVVGYIAAVVAASALITSKQRAAGRIGWSAVALLAGGMALALPEMLMVWAFSAQNSFIHDVFMPYVTSPVLSLGGAASWIAAGVVAIGLLRGVAVPRGAAALVLAAAMLALGFEFRLVPQVFWIAASVLVFAAFVWIVRAAKFEYPAPRHAALRPS